MSRPGQVVVEKILVHDFNKTRSFNITDDLVSLKIHEDVFKNTMYGHIVFLDKMNALEELPILGEEYLSIKFHLPFDTSKKREFEFFIYAIEGLSFDDSQRYTAVTLKFVSFEQITNAKKLISYGFRDGKVTDYVKKVIEDQVFLNSKKKLKVQDSTETKTLALPYLTPFEMIEFFRKNAFNSNTKTSSYMFFENAEGFNFYTLEGLIKENRENPIKLYYQPTQDKKDEEDLLYKTRTITNISYVSLNDTLESMRRGTYNTKMMFFDFNTKVFNTEQFKILDEFQNFTHLDQNGGLKNSEEFLKSIAPDSTEYYVFNKSYFLPDDSSRDNNTTLLSVKEMAKHFAYLEMLQQTPMVCSIYGDATIKAGDVVNIQIPQPTAAEASTGRQMQKYLNGNYFVGRVNHVIEGDYYKMQMNLYKESYASKIVKQNPFYANGTANVLETVVKGGGGAP